MTAKIRVLIVDDSAFMRKALCIMLQKDPLIEIVGEAEDGLGAVEKAQALKPDVITMDLEMPHLDGFGAIERIRKLGMRIPVLVVSSVAQDGAEATVRALALGAADYIPKPSSFVSLSIRDIEIEFLSKVRAVCGFAGPAPASAVAAVKASPPQLLRGRLRMVLLGSSTGGSEALAKLLPDIPASFPVPIVIAQHMPEAFTGLLAGRLSSLCPLGVQEIQGGEILNEGKPTVYLAKGQRHVLLNRVDGRIRTDLTTDRMGCFYMPSVTILFQSARRALEPAGLLCVVLTGMGEDGKEGAIAVHQGGGRVIVQDQESSVVWGMPGAIAKAGAADEILPLGKIASRMAAIAG